MAPGGQKYDEILTGCDARTGTAVTEFFQERTQIIFASKNATLS
jgi:hypothetical protein